MMLQEGSEFFPSTLALRHCWQAKYSGIRKSGTPDLKSTRLVLRHCHNPRTGSCNAVAPSSATPPTQTLPKQMAPLPRLKAAMGRNLRPRLHSRYRDSWRRCPGWRLRCSRRWTENGVSIPLGKQATKDLCGRSRLATCVEPCVFYHREASRTPKEFQRKSSPRKPKPFTNRVLYFSND